MLIGVDGGEVNCKKERTVSLKNKVAMSLKRNDLLERVQAFAPGKPPFLWQIHPLFLEVVGLSPL